MAKRRRDSAKLPLLYAVKIGFERLGPVSAPQALTSAQQLGYRGTLASTQMALMRYAKQGLMFREWSGVEYHYRLSASGLSTLDYLKNWKPGFKALLQLLQVASLNDNLSYEEIKLLCLRISGITLVSHPQVSAETMSILTILNIFMMKFANARSDYQSCIAALREAHRDALTALRDATRS